MYIPPGKHRFVVLKDDGMLYTSKKHAIRKWGPVYLNELKVQIRSFEIPLRFSKVER